MYKRCLKKCLYNIMIISLMNDLMKNMMIFDEMNKGGLAFNLNCGFKMMLWCVGVAVGIKTNQARPPLTLNISNMKLLELFSGTCSVGNVATKYGYSVTSLDLKGANINCNILDWDYRQFPSGYYDFIWSSPPCTEYSRAKTVGVRNIDEANKIVLKTIEIIKYFRPRIWFIENPQTGLLKQQPFMSQFNYYDVDYCKYGFRYRKRTRLWTNLVGWSPQPLCKKIATAWTETVTKKVRKGGLIK